MLDPALGLITALHSCDVYNPGAGAVAAGAGQCVTESLERVIDLKNWGGASTPCRSLRWPLGVKSQVQRMDLGLAIARAPAGRYHPAQARQRAGTAVCIGRSCIGQAQEEVACPASHDAAFSCKPAVMQCCARQIQFPLKILPQL